MQVNSAATMQIDIARPTETLRSLSEKMKYQAVGFLPVVDGDKVIGVITDRDIVVRGIASGKDPDYVQAKMIMTAPVAFVYEDADLYVAAKLMRERRVRRLLVKDRQDNAKGVISLDDMAVFMHGDQLIGSVLEKVAERAVSAWPSTPEYDLED